MRKKTETPKLRPIDLIRAKIFVAGSTEQLALLEAVSKGLSETIPRNRYEVNVACGYTMTLASSRLRSPACGTYIYSKFANLMNFESSQSDATIEASNTSPVMYRLLCSPAEAKKRILARSQANMRITRDGKSAPRTIDKPTNELSAHDVLNTPFELVTTRPTVAASKYGTDKKVAAEEKLVKKVVKAAKPVDREGNNHTQGGAGFGDPIENKLVETAAINAVKKRYENDGWNVRSVERDRCGFDLECRRRGVVENVEVKGIRATEQCFIITTGEVEQAKKNSNFVLMVVTSALSASPILTRYSGAEFGQRFNLSPIQYRATLRS